MIQIMKLISYSIIQNNFNYNLSITNLLYHNHFINEVGIAVCSTSMSIWQLVSPDDPELEGERGKFGSSCCGQ